MDEKIKNKLKNGYALTMMESSEVYNYILELEDIIVEANIIKAMTKQEAIEYGQSWLAMNYDSKDSSIYKFFEIAVQSIKENMKQ